MNFSLEELIRIRDYIHEKTGTAKQGVKVIIHSEWNWGTTIQPA